MLKTPLRLGPSFFLSNTPYHSKGYGNRLRVVSGNLVGPFQTAFIPMRQLVDSAVVANEIQAVLQRKGIKGFKWKVDFTKACDFVDWDFKWSSMR